MKSTPPASSSRPPLWHRLGVLSVATVGLLTAPVPSSRAFTIITDVNTLPQAQFGNVSSLVSGGGYYVFQNSRNSSGQYISPTDPGWTNVVNTLGGRSLTEDIEGNYIDFQAFKTNHGGQNVNYSLFYHEANPMPPGGTLLTPAEASNHAASVSKLVELTRTYASGTWHDKTLAAIQNPDVSGVAIEMAPYYGSVQSTNTAGFINDCIANNKDAYLLFSYTTTSSGDYYDQLRSAFQALYQLGANLASSRVFLVVGNYTSTQPGADPNHLATWPGAEGTNSVQGAITWANNQKTWPGRYYFQDQSSLFYMDVSGASTANNAAIDQFSLKNAKNQQWYLLYATGGHYNMVNVNSDLAASVQGDSTANGAGLVQFSISGKDGSTGQLWTPQLSGSAWLFYNDTNGKVLDNNNSGAAGTQLIQYTHNGNSTQLWTRTNAP